MSLPNWVPTHRRTEFSALGHAAKARARMSRDIDPETMHRRALHDARGQLLRDGRTYRGDGTVQHWQVVRSVRGRIDQRDVMIDGRHHRTCGPRRLPAWLR